MARTGSFLCLSSSAQAREDDDWLFHLLERALEGIQAVGTFPGLYSGFPGVAWVLEHLQGVLFDVEGDDPGEEAARVLEGYLKESPWPWGPGLLGGLTGLGVYALERLPRPGGLACLKEVMAQLTKSAEQLPDGIAWKTRLEDSLEEARQRFPGGRLRSWAGAWRAWDRCAARRCLHRGP